MEHFSSFDFGSVILGRMVNDVVVGAGVVEEAGVEVVSEGF